MTLPAPATADARAVPDDTRSKSPTWLSAIGVRQVRLVTGLVLYAYVFSHFFNHALGNISYAAMDTWLAWHTWWWRLPMVNDMLYVAAAIHLSLGLWALYHRRHFRYTAAEITQLVLGLSIPLLIANHLGGVRVSGWLFGYVPAGYAGSLYGYWVTRPDLIAVQFTLLLVAWTHGSIGLYFWLRLKRFFRWAWPILFAVAVLLPVLAMLGTIQGAREVAQLARQSQWLGEHVTSLPAPQRAIVDDVMLFWFPIAYVIAILLVFVARGLRSLLERRRGMITISYPDRQVRVPRGLSILEASLRHKIPHASVCGGRARCSTCRVRVVSDRFALPPPSQRESLVLARVGAGENPAVRLACQVRPQSDVSIIPIIPPHVNVDFVRRRGRVNSGRERYIVCMFVDMRGSTKFAEKRLPFDVVFIVNRFLGAASQAAVDAGGQPNQFVGDGLLALFGLDCDPKTACRQALRAAAKVAANVEHMNHQFASELPEPIRFGIGIHGGDVIIGDIGFKEHTVFTALGDAVNVAARLQDMTKSLDCTVIISEDVCATAGIAPGALEQTRVSIRGRDEAVSVRTAVDPTVLASLLEPASAEHSAVAAM